MRWIDKMQHNTRLNGEEKPFCAEKSQLESKDYFIVLKSMIHLIRVHLFLNLFLYMLDIYFKLYLHFSKISLLLLVLASSPTFSFCIS